MPLAGAPHSAPSTLQLLLASIARTPEKLKHLFLLNFQQAVHPLSIIITIPEED